MSILFSEEARDKLEETRRKEEEDLTVILSKKYGVGHANLQLVEIHTEALRLIPEKESQDAELAAFQIHGKDLSIGLRTPNSEKVKKIIRELKERGYNVFPYMVSRASLEHAWSRYKDISLAMETTSGVLTISDEEIVKLKEKITTLADIRTAIASSLEMQKQYRITRILEIIIAGALTHNASDVHLEPREEETMIRFRLDGVLTDIIKFDLETYFALLTRVKLLSGLKINIKNAPQDGRFSIHIEKKEIEIRTSILPGGNGESIVLRILDPYTIGIPLDALGMRDGLKKKMIEEIGKPNGMILNTGPTGSGKTTTLYAFMKYILSPDTKMLTIEDPIEYHLEGVVQTQVNHKDYTFASGLRSALRQDPDIIMVGEIRDSEVAETAIHAALTGHLVFSTLHTNNAAGAFPRLIDMGIQPSMVGSAVNAVMAQRLVRKIQHDESDLVPIEGSDKEFVEKVLQGVVDKTLIPNNTTMMRTPHKEAENPYKGRIAVYEVVYLTREIEQTIRKNLTTRELEDEAKKQQSFLSMKEDAVLKVLEGVTTLEEVYRVLGETAEE